MKNKLISLAKSTRFFRKLHKFVAIPILLFVFIMSISGILLAWKKELKLQPPSQAHVANNAKVSLNDIQTTAIAFADSLALSNTINRIDYRPSKGIAKVRFEHHFTELQINCNNGEIVSVEHRTADLIEMIHDGSIVDFVFDSENDTIKLLYSTLIGSGLLLLSISGFYLWIRPRQMRKLKKSNA